MVHQPIKIFLSCHVSARVQTVDTAVTVVSTGESVNNKEAWQAARDTATETPDHDFRHGGEVIKSSWSSRKEELVLRLPYLQVLAHEDHLESTFYAEQNNQAETT